MLPAALADFLGWLAGLPELAATFLQSTGIVPVAQNFLGGGWQQFPHRILRIGALGSARSARARKLRDITAPG